MHSPLRRHETGQLVALLLISLAFSTATVQARPISQRTARCSSLPTARAAAAGSWPLSCVNAMVSSKCRARCLVSRGSNLNSSSASPAFSVTTCLEGGRWSQPTACNSSSSSSNNRSSNSTAVCLGTPRQVPGALWDCSSSSNSSSTAGSVCRSSCLPGYTGSSYASSCLPSGRWQAPRSSSSSSSDGCIPLSAIPSTTTCKGLPQDVANAAWDAGCADTALPLSSCAATCSAAAGYQGPGYVAICTESGQWAAPTGAGCKPSGNSSSSSSSSGSTDQPTPKQQCSGPPPTVQGVLWEPCDSSSNGARCTGFCKAPYRGHGYVTRCNIQGEWDVPKKQLKNDVGCVATSCAGSLPADVPGGAKWDPACGNADAGKTVCFAFCESGAAAYLAECLASTGLWAEPFKLGDCVAVSAGSLSP